MTDRNSLPAGRALLLVLALAANALAADLYTRRLLETGDLSIELPSTWTVTTPDKDRILVREHPAEDLIAALSVEIFPATASLRWWKDFHREDQIENVYPSCRILVDEERQAGEFKAHVFRVTGLGGARADYDLLQAIIAPGKYFIIVTLYYQKGRSAHYDPIFDHMISSVRRNSEGISVKRLAVKLGPPARDQIDWARGFDEAFAEAERRGVPVMIAFNMDNEWANDLIAGDYYRDPRVIELSREMVCLISSVFDHGGIEEPDGTRRPCPRFGRVVCVEHRDTDVAAREKYIKSRIVIAPQHLFCAPDGRMLLRREWHLPKRDLVNMMERAVSAVQRISKDEGGASLEELLARYEKAPDAAARHWILSDVLYSGRQDLVQRFLDQVSDTSSPEAIVELMDGIGYAGHPLGVPLALRGLDHREEEVRTHAAVALEQIASQEAAGALKRRLGKETVEAVRKNVLRALGACAGEDERIAKILIARAGRGGELERANAIIALKHFPDDERVKETLVRLVEKDASARVRAAAAWTLGFLHHEPARDLLAAYVASEADGLVRSACAQAVGRIDGTLDPKVAYEEILERIAGDEIFRKVP